MQRFQRQSWKDPDRTSAGGTSRDPSGDGVGDGVGDGEGDGEGDGDGDGDGDGEGDGDGDGDGLKGCPAAVNGQTLFGGQT